MYCKLLLALLDLRWTAIHIIVLLIGSLSAVDLRGTPQLPGGVVGARRVSPVGLESRAASHAVLDRLGAWQEAVEGHDQQKHGHQQDYSTQHQNPPPN